MLKKWKIKLIMGDMITFIYFTVFRVNSARKLTYRVDNLKMYENS